MKLKKIIKILNKGWFHLIYLFKPIRIFAFPESICIETSTHCTLKCPCCPTGKRNKELSKGFLKFQDFKRFLDKYGLFIKEICLSNKGEIFLNPEIFEIIQYAKNKGIETYADTNLNYFNKEMAEKLVLSGMSELTIAIDGASQKSYSKYRVNGNFNKVISNIKKINESKKKYNSKSPLLEWQFIIFGHNENEIGKAKKMAKELGMNFFLRSSWDKKFSPPANLDKIKEKFGVYTKEESFCNQLWTFPTINYNGNMLGCCILCEERYNLGNVFEKGFFKVYNGEHMKKARKMVLDKLGKDESIFCAKCHLRENPQSVLFNKNFQKKKDLLVTLADKNFINQAKQVFSSVYWNAGWKGDYMLLAHEISEKELKWFRDKGILVKKCKPLYDKPIGRDNYPSTVLDKFYLFTEEFKKWGHIVFLDGDVIVDGPLDRLTKTKSFSSPKILNHNFDSYFSFNSKEEKEKFNREHNFSRPTFNSGVMSYNTDLIKKDTFEKLIFLFNKYKNILNGDDSIFNLFFYPVWKKVPQRYNIRVNNTMKNKGVILHFEKPFRQKENNCKPWDKENLFYNEWKSNLGKAELIDLTKIQPVKKSSKLSWFFIQ